eukprot:gene24508-10107_t
MLHSPSLRVSAPLRHRASRLVVKAQSSSNAKRPSSRTQKLRELLASPGIKKGPCCHDALSARLIERAGFPYAFMSGFCTSSAKLGAPDVGLISYGEMVDQGRYINEATHSMPIIGDGDTGYGNAMNVKRTVRGYAQAGFAGILIEDQIAPKSCGHVKGKKITGREEAVSRIRAAADARDEGADILIVARTDARQAVSLEEALWRAQAFADAGADILFIDALESAEEMQAFCNVDKNVPKLCIRAMEIALEGLKDGKIPDERSLGSFGDIQAAVGFPDYYTEEASSYKTHPLPPAALGQLKPTTAGTKEHKRERFGASTRTPSDPPSTSVPVSEPSPVKDTAAPKQPPKADAAAPEPVPQVVEADVVVEQPTPKQPPKADTADPEPLLQMVEADAVDEELSQAAVMVTSRKPSGGEDSDQSSSSSGSRKSIGDGEDRRSKFFLVKITDGTSGYVKLETRIPAGFLSGLTAL